MKVTDKRMFTPEGELREEYRFLEERAKAGAEEAAKGREERRDEAAGRAEASRPSDSREAQPGAPAGPAAGGPGGAGARPASEVPGFEASAGPGPAPAFLDLLGVMAEPIPFYLGDARLPTGESGENLEAARFYIDLLDVLRQKTAGNLAPQEADALEDLLYRLRLRYVQKRR
jgi:hypothetical protein